MSELELKHTKLVKLDYDEENYNEMSNQIPHLKITSNASY